MIVSIVEMDSHKACSKPYDFNHPKQGYALIFGNKKFRNNECPDRAFADMDIDRLLKTLSSVFKFDVIPKLDRTSEQMIQDVKEVSELDHSAVNCLVVVFNSYGDNGLIYGSDGLTVSMVELMDPLYANKCPKLAAKPKIIILQTCHPTWPQIRGDDEGLQTVPAEADFFYVWSHLPGYLDYHKWDGNSLFIHKLVKNLQRLNPASGDQAAIEFAHLMTITIRDVTAEITTRYSKLVRLAEDGKIHYHPIPHTQNMLTKDLYFKVPTSH